MGPHHTDGKARLLEAIELRRVEMERTRATLSALVFLALAVLGTVAAMGMPPSVQAQFPRGVPVGRFGTIFLAAAAFMGAVSTVRAITC